MRTATSLLTVIAATSLTAACPGNEPPIPDGKEPVPTAQAKPQAAEPTPAPEPAPPTPPSEAQPDTDADTDAPARDPAAGTDEPEQASEPSAPARGAARPRSKPASEPARVEQAPAGVDGRALYLAKCKTCHGADGKAQTKMGEKHDIPDMTVDGWDGKWPRTKIVQIITNGKSGTKMRSFKDKLSAEEIEAVADFVRKL